MASYSILWKRSAEHELKRLDRSAIPHILTHAETLASEPFPPGHRKLRGSESVYRIRSGDYRIIYHVDAAAGVITIYHIRHRKDAYRRA